MVKWQLMKVFHLKPKILLKISQFLAKQRIIAACSLEPFNRVLPKHFKLYFSLNFIVSSLPKKRLVLFSCAVYKVLNLCEKYAPHILCLLALSPKLRLVPPPIHISTWQFWNHKSMKFPMKVEKQQQHMVGIVGTKLFAPLLLSGQTQPLSFEWVGGIFRTKGNHSSNFFQLNACLQHRYIML